MVYGMSIQAPVRASSRLDSRGRGAILRVGEPDEAPEPRSVGDDPDFDKGLERYAGKGNVSAQRYREAFDTGFDIAAKTLFKLMKEGSPGDWDELVIAGK